MPIGETDLQIRAHHVETLRIRIERSKALGIPITPENLANRALVVGKREEKKLPSLDYTGGTEEGAKTFLEGVTQAYRDILESSPTRKTIVNGENDKVCASCAGPQPRHCDRRGGILDKLLVYEVYDYAKNHGFPATLWLSSPRPSVETVAGAIQQFVRHRRNSYGELL